MRLALRRTRRAAIAMGAVAAGKTGVLASASPAAAASCAPTELGVPYGVEDVNRFYVNVYADCTYAIDYIESNHNGWNLPTDAYILGGVPPYGSSDWSIVGNCASGVSNGKCSSSGTLSSMSSQEYIAYAKDSHNLGEAAAGPVAAGVYCLLGGGNGWAACGKPAVGTYGPINLNYSSANDSGWS